MGEGTNARRCTRLESQTSLTNKEMISISTILKTAQMPVPRIESA